MPSLILFDIDGTLLSAGGASKRAFERAFHEIFAFSEAWGALDARGQTDPNLLALVAEKVLGRSLAGHEIEAFNTRFTSIFQDEVRTTPNFRVYPGVPELCRALSEIDDVLMGIQTGNIEPNAWLKLKRAGIDHYFECGGFGSDSHNRGELVQRAIERAEACLGEKFSKEEIFVIGDTPFDAKAAYEVGVQAICVKTSGHLEDEFRQYRPLKVCEDLSGTEELLRILVRP